MWMRELGEEARGSDIKSRRSRSPRGADEAAPGNGKRGSHTDQSGASQPGCRGGAGKHAEPNLAAQGDSGKIEEVIPRLCGI